jgi:hypothetical protein
MKVEQISVFLEKPGRLSRYPHPATGINLRALTRPTTDWTCG